MRRKTTHRRLLALAAFLRELPARKWDFSQFSAHGLDDKRPGRPELDPHHCKTVACAAGWATVIPSFQRAGLFLNDFGDPQYGDESGVDAMSGVLGIKLGVAEQIFTNPRFYGWGEYRKVTKTMVARALEKLAKEYE